MRILLPFVLSAALTGCIVYDEELVWDDGTPVNPDRDPIDREDPPNDDPPAQDDGFSLSPRSGQPGQSLILFVASDDGGLATVVDAEFFGPSDLVVTATAPNGDASFLVTVEIPGDAAPGANDLLLENDDGTVVFLRDAFDVN